jgi:ATP-dependent exoDNAse (exonuclease V) alpha subunit
MTAAGFYHCSVKSVGRANGRSVVAAAAYRSGARLTDERTGEVFDYRARSGVVESFIIASENAPAWAQDREQLWSRAELAETRANGRLATELELALPHELPPEQRRELLLDFLASIIEQHGTVADIAIHEPGQGKDHRNIHAHVLLTHRMLDEEGFIEKAKGLSVPAEYSPKVAVRNSPLRCAGCSLLS